MGIDTRRQDRKGAAKYGWFNWYLDRGHIALGLPGKERAKWCRMVSWRRAF